QEAGEMLRTFLAGRDIECPQCHYNLRDLVGDRCPECGDQLVLRVNLAEPKLGVMIAGLVGLSAGAGFSGLLLIYIAIQAMLRPGWSGGGFWNFFLTIAAGFLVEGLLALLWVVKWRKIRHLPQSTRRFLVGACWLLTLVNILVFSLRIR
ncbi:MAG TPA: hypothetical protein VHS31_13325, partial [Tepidisphaeraceae bacterium]|nr:hypothetical protein [Tepidisphaeraceae bacterium]